MSMNWPTSVENLYAICWKYYMTSLIPFFSLNKHLSCAKDAVLVPCHNWDCWHFGTLFMYFFWYFFAAFLIVHLCFLNYFGFTQLFQFYTILCLCISLNISIFPFFNFVIILNKFVLHVFWSILIPCCFIIFFFKSQIWSYQTTKNRY